MSDQQQASDTPTIEQLQSELEKVRDALKKANAESADRRKKLEQYESQDNQNLSDVQRLQAELETERKSRGEVESRLRTLRIERAVTDKAKELQFQYPDDVVRFIDVSKVEIAEDGKITGFEKTLDELAKSGRLPMGNSSRRLSTPPAVPGAASSGKNPIDDIPINVKL